MENNLKVARVHNFLTYCYGITIVMILIIVIFIGVISYWVLFLLLALYALHYFVARGAKEKKGWAKITSTVFAIIILIIFPVGTLVGIYLLLNNSDWNEAS